MNYRIIKYGKYWRIVDATTGKWSYKKFNYREQAKRYLYTKIKKIKKQ